MRTKLEHDFTKNTKVYFEHSVEINDNSYLIIFGHHINGGFIAIPNWNICCEASAHNDNSYLIIFGHHINGGFIAIPNWNICCEASAHNDSSYYNRMKLIDAGMDEIIAKEISEYINSWIEVNYTHL